MSTNLTNASINPWLAPELAAGQYALVCRELAEDAAGHPPAPFAAFHRAMQFLTRTLGPEFDLLDMGCGCGHYGVLCARHYPGVRYWGSDASPSMIAQAVQLVMEIPIRGVLRQCEWDANEFENFDVVLVSQVLEATDDPPAALETVLARSRRFVILHRLRDAARWGMAGRVIEKTYCDLDAPNWVWDLNAVEAAVRKFGKVLYRDYWQRSATLVCEMTRGEKARVGLTR